MLRNTSLFQHKTAPLRGPGITDVGRQRLGPHEGAEPAVWDPEQPDLDSLCPLSARSITAAWRGSSVRGGGATLLDLLVHILHIMLKGCTCM